MQRRRAQKTLFEYPAVPEFRVYFVVTLTTLIYAWWCVFNASSKFTFRFGFPATLHNLPLVGRRFKDEFDWEWSRWSPLALANLPYMFLGSAVFNFTPKLMPERWWMISTVIVSMASSALLFTPKLLIMSVLQGSFVFLCARITGQIWTIWISSIPILYFIMHHTSALSPDPFLVLIFVSYTLLSYISFNIDTVKGLGRPEDVTYWQKYLRMLFYTFYQPYMVSLIVLYSDFERQIREREERPRDWRKITSLALRMVFWWCVLELMLHFFYFGAILSDIDFAASLPKNEFVVMGMAVANFFHMKYVIIFGLPSVFALIDNMQPKDGPICIARVAMISKIWRGFDRGLYDFFKEYIFIPICTPTFSLPRKLVGVLVSYSFVLLWHGFQHHNIVWILLNIVELIMEFSSKALYTIPRIRQWREDNISDVNFRRILAALQIVPYAFGLYSNFYFLGGSKVGYLFVKRIFYEETITLRWPFLLLITLGYNYMHVTMEAERWLSRNKNERNPNIKAE